MKTALELIESAESRLLSGKYEEASALARMAQAKAYVERTEFLGEFVGWDVGGTLDQYFEAIRKAILGGRQGGTW